MDFKIKANKRAQLGGGLILMLVGVFLSILLVTIFVPMWEESIDDAYYTTAVHNESGAHTDSQGVGVLFKLKPVFSILAAIIPIGAFGYMGIQKMRG